MPFLEQSFQWLLACDCTQSLSITPVLCLLFQDIVSRLANHSVQLQDAFGSYQLTSWKLQPLTNRLVRLVTRIVCPLVGVWLIG